jgi:fibronectin type 3 domain-containing protein
LTLNASTGVISGTPTAAGNGTPLTFQVTDSTKPTAQTETGNFTIAISGGVGHSVLLNWDASLSSAASGYNVYRSNTSGTGYSKISSTPVSGLTYTDQTVASGETYYYVTTAVDSSGDESSFSNEIQEAIP